MSHKPTSLNQGHTPSKASLSPKKTKLTQYVGFFMVGYLLASALLMLLQTQMALNPQLVTLIATLAGAFIAVQKFSKHQQRALSKAQINQLALSSTAIIWLLTALYFLAIWLWLFDGANRQVFIEMTMQQPWRLLISLIAIMLLTLISARVSLWLFNRLLAPKP